MGKYGTPSRTGAYGGRKTLVPKGRKANSPYLDVEESITLMFCTDPAKCILDENLKPIYKKFQEADGLIVATPIMTMGILGRLKSFMDLFQSDFISKYVLKAPLIPEDKREKRKGLFFSIAGMKDDPIVFDGATTTVTAFFEILYFHYRDDLLIDDMDTIRDLKIRPVIRKSAYTKGAVLAKALEKIAR
ncbi:MAG: NAD(P)H-dependent oxidoreductase [Methanomicrobiales archaeon]